MRVCVRCGSVNENSRTRCDACAAKGIHTSLYLLSGICGDEDKYWHMMPTRIKGYESRGVKEMTPQEELFKNYYNNERGVVVASMTDDQLRAHRDELKRVAFEARVRYTAAEDELNERTSKRRGSSVRALQQDDIATNAIQNVRTRAARMSKIDKARQNLLDMGISEEEVDKMMSASSRAELRSGSKPVNGEEKKEEENKPKSNLNLGSMFNFGK